MNRPNDPAPLSPNDFVRGRARPWCLPAAFAVVVAGLALQGCNTTEGFGEDVENLGDAIEDSAADAKD